MSAFLSSRTLIRASCSICQASTTSPATAKRFAHKLVQVELLTDLPALGRRGDRVPVARGHARYLDSRGEANLVINNRPSSALREMMRKESEREALLWRGLAPSTNSKAIGGGVQSASDVLDEIVVDQRQLVREREQALYDSLLTIRSLQFERLAHAQSTDLFGSVTLQDILSTLSKQFSIRLDDSVNITLKGVENMRIKQIGTYECIISFKELEHTIKLPIEVKQGTTSDSE